MRSSSRDRLRGSRAICCLPASQRLDVATASDMQIVNEMALCIATYMSDLFFQRDKYRPLYRIAL